MNLASYVKSDHGRQSHLAKAVGVQRQLIYQWVHNRRPIPIERCVAIERATGGAVTRRDLRPDDWWKIWPELVDGDIPWPDGIARPDVEDGAGDEQAKDKCDG